MAKKLKINLDRANVSSSLDILETMWDGHGAGLTWSDAAGQVVAEKAIERYQVHIAAAFARYGVAIEPGAPITAATVLDAINQKTGLNVSSLTPGGMSEALDGQIAARVSEVLGVEVSSMQDIDRLKKTLVDSAKEAVTSGRATKLVSRGMIAKIRAMKAYKEAGVNEELERKKVANRAYQKKYRRTHKEVWVGSPGDPGAGSEE